MQTTARHGVGVQEPASHSSQPSIGHSVRSSDSSEAPTVRPVRSLSGPRSPRELPVVLHLVRRPTGRFTPTLNDLGCSTEGAGHALFAIGSLRSSGQTHLGDGFEASCRPSQRTSAQYSVCRSRSCRNPKGRGLARLVRIPVRPWRSSGTNSAGLLSEPI